MTDANGNETTNEDANEPTNEDAKVELCKEIEEKLEEVLRERKVTKCAFDVSPGTVKGDNYLGVVYKIGVKGHNEDGTRVEFNWIVKSAPQNKIMREGINVDKLYAREIFVYEKFFPAMKNFHLERHILGSFGTTAPLITTHCVAPNEAIVMQDLKALGFVMKNRMEPMDYNHVRLVMKTYGKLHAFSFALRDQNPAEFQQMRSELLDVFFLSDQALNESTLSYIAMINNKVLEAFDPNRDAKVIELFKKYQEGTIHLVREAIQRGLDGEYSVFGHGDSWVNNMLFKYDNLDYPNIPTDVCLLDWQLARIGSPALDLSYFIFTCTDKKLRDEHYDQMLKTYHYSLCLHLTMLGSDPSLFPFEALEQEMRNSAVVGLYMSIMVLYLMMSESSEIPDWSNATSEEEFADSMDYETKNISVYKDRATDVVKDFVRKGYLDFLL